MYRVMIVDDEPLILAGITSMVDWEAEGFKIVGKAANGQQALAQMEELKPDIVVTDIKMPAMDGLSFMREAKNRQYGAEFILLTNLEEFSLAREALTLGAVDYLVKLELDESSLTDALRRAAKRCQARQKNGAGEREELFEETKEEAIRGYFRRLLVFDSQARAGEELLRLIQKEFEEPFLMLINFNYGFEDFSQAFTREDQKKVMGFAENIISEMVRGFFDTSSVIRREQDGFILVLSARGAGDYKEQARRMGEKFLSVLKDYFEVSAFITVSQKGHGVEEFPELLYQVMTAMNYTYYEWSQPIVVYSKDCEESSRHSSNFNISFLKKDLGNAIRHSDREAFASIMDQVISLLSGSRPSRIQAINACSNLYYFITSFFENRQEEAFPWAVDIIGQLNRMGSLKDIICWTTWFKEQVEAVLAQGHDTRTDRHVELAQRYVEEHIREKITLGQAAKELGISQGHLSSIFKKQTGQNFSDYVTEVRVEKAKELLRTRKYMMYEISDMLGFDTQYYFSTVFKKLTGYTPKEYESLEHVPE